MTQLDHRSVKQANDTLTMEPGCRLFEVWIASDRPSSFNFDEVYDSRNALETHLSSTDFKAVDEKVASFVASKSVSLFNRRVGGTTLVSGQR